MKKTSPQLAVLKKYWNYDDFRSLQGDVIQSVLDQKDTLALLPTGGGKSICFQVPALVMEGICIVICPLIALMKDQVQNLEKRNISAIAITSELSKQEINQILDHSVNGDIKFLYVSPERLKSETFIQRIPYMNISLLAVDESHCISQWGYDFRPDYLEIVNIKNFFNKEVPTLALTASATPQVVNDIQEKLEFKQKNVLRKSFERKNVSYMVLYPKDKNLRLLKILNKVNSCGIVYAGSRRQTKEISDFLNSQNISADFYHAGLSISEKERKQKNWQDEITRVIVATNAFGMGIDKPNVRIVVHMNIPVSIEAYFQEAGRAGRDEQKAYAVILATENDFNNIKRMHMYNTISMDLVKKIYTQLMNFLSIVKGEGQDKIFSFAIHQFCSKYNFQITTVYKILKFLESEGVLIFSMKGEARSTLKFITSDEYLFKYYERNPNLEEFIKTLLRSYTQITDKVVYIDENKIAERIYGTYSSVKNLLKMLNSHQIIEYKSASNEQYITILKNREDNYLINSISKNVKVRNECNTLRLNAILDYIKNKEECRNIQLLKYFGEIEYTRCKQCDVCLK